MDRYDEALAKARAGKSLEEIFPEMKESEDERDERIRKAIVHLLTVASESYLIDATGFKKEQFLSSLEKQKEQKEIPLMNGDADLYFDNWIQHNDTTKRGCFEEGIRYAQRLQKGQKPVDRSLEDDHIIGFVYDLLNEIEWKDNWAMSKEECLRRLKSLRPSWKPSEEQMEALDKALYYVPEKIGIPIAEIYGHFNKMKKKLI